MTQKLIKRKSATKGRTGIDRGLGALVLAVGGKSAKDQFPAFSAGDTIRVHVRIKEGGKERVQAFEGLCIRIRGAGSSKAFTVRKVTHGVGVERVFQYNSPKLAKIEVMEKGRVRRAKLYYIRELEGRAARIGKDMRTKAPAAGAKAKTAKPESAPKKS